MLPPSLLELAVSVPSWARMSMGYAPSLLELAVSVPSWARMSMGYAPSLPP